MLTIPAGQFPHSMKRENMLIMKNTLIIVAQAEAISTTIS